MEKEETPIEEQQRLKNEFKKAIQSVPEDDLFTVKKKSLVEKNNEESTY